MYCTPSDKTHCGLACSDPCFSASFMRRKGAQLLVACLGLYGAGDAKDGAVTKEACYALRSVTMGDDRRKDFSCKLSCSTFHSASVVHVDAGSPAHRATFVEHSRLLNSTASRLHRSWLRERGVLNTSFYVSRRLDRVLSTRAHPLPARRQLHSRTFLFFARRRVR